MSAARTLIRGDGAGGGRVPVRSFFLANAIALAREPGGEGEGRRAAANLGYSGPARRSHFGCEPRETRAHAGRWSGVRAATVRTCPATQFPYRTHRVATASSTEAIIHATTQPHRSKAVGAVGRDPEQRGPQTGRAHAGDNFNKRAGMCELARSTYTYRRNRLLERARGHAGAAHSKQSV